MTRLGPALALVVVLGAAPALALPPGALVRLPEPGQLVAAVRSGDEVEIERVAARLGAVRLEHIAERGRREERLAALRAIALVDDGWAVLTEVARLCSDGDGDVAEAAGRAARRLAEALTPELRAEREVPPDVPARAAAELLAEARKGELSPSVRLSVIAGAAALRAVTRVDEARLVDLLGDAEPQVRRAAAEALVGARTPPANPRPGTAAVPGPTAVDRALETALAGDHAPEVAAAAGATLCRDVPALGKGPAVERVAHLGPPARDRLRALALDEAVALADRLDLVPCLRVNSQAADQKALDALAKRPPESLRRRARAYGGR